MALILALNLIFGTMFVVRTLKKFRTDPLVDHNHLTKIGTILVCSQFFVAFFLIHHPIPTILSVFLLSSSIWCAQWILRTHSRQKLEAEFPLYVNDVLLNIRLGQGFSSASRTALKDRSEQFARALQHLLEAQSIYIGDARSHLFLTDRALREMRTAHRQSHSALKRMESLRDELNLMSDFRRKSGQATAQARIQGLVLWCLLFALSFFVITQSGFASNRLFIGMAFVLFVLGQVSFNYLTRKRHWKV